MFVNFMTFGCRFRQLCLIAGDNDTCWLSAVPKRPKRTKALLCSIHK